MKQMVKDLKLPLLLIVLMSLCAMIALPITPIDETRYVSVAWGMWTHHSFLVPLLNGVPYPDKPPMLFWLMQAGWALFGVNDYTPRLIPGIFSLLNLILVYRISLRLWPEERRTAVYAALVLATLAVWDIWSVAIMFDMVLTFWILLGLLGTLRAADGDRGGFLLTALAVAGGILTKGPAIFVYLLSIPLLRFLWDNRQDVPTRKLWTLRILGVALLGLAISLLWVIPAVIQGGETYRSEILWGQTADRITSSFAHRRPIWWYLPIVPLLFFPWILFRSSFSRLQWKNGEMGSRFCLVWLGVPLLIFSLISGKQVHYLIPFIPAGALLIGRSLRRLESGGRIGSLKWIGSLYLLTGIVALIMPFVHLHTQAVTFTPLSTTIAVIGFMSAGIFLIVQKPASLSSAARRIAVSTTLIAITAFLAVKTSFIRFYDMRPVARQVHRYMANGCPVAHLGKYRGQYQFYGRLTNSVTVIDQTSDAIDAFAANHPNALFISYSHRLQVLPEGAELRYTHRYRGKSVELWQMNPSASNPTQ